MVPMMDPTSMALMMGAGAAAGGPSSAQSGFGGGASSFMDGSGWTVATSSASAEGARILKSGDPNVSPLGLAAAGALGGIDVTTLAIVALGAVVLLRVLRRK